MQINYVSGILLCALIALGSYANANEASPHCVRVSDAADSASIVNIDALAAQLNLSTQQVNKIRDIVNDISTPVRAMQEKMQAQRDMLLTLRSAKVVDYSAIQVLADKQARLLEDLLQLRSKTQAAINAELTPEQLEQLRSAHHS